MSLGILYKKETKISNDRTKYIQFFLTWEKCVGYGKAFKVKIEDSLLVHIDNTFHDSIKSTVQTDAWVGHST